ncbi:MAG: YraN family protein [Deltaproteobacteria bacterium]|nr:YraN family protein [Deltaproteobacteria bacterium]
MKNQSLGWVGEGIAKTYLVQKGFQILHHRWTCRWGEIDFIAQKSKRIHFIEVKTRNNFEEVLTAQKKHALYRAGQYFIQSFHSHLQPLIQFDLILIVPKASSSKIFYYPHIMEDPW